MPISATVGVLDPVAKVLFTAQAGVTTAPAAPTNVTTDGVNVSYASRAVIKINASVAAAADVPFQIWVVWENDTEWVKIDGGDGTFPTGDTTWSTLIDCSVLSRIFIQMTMAAATAETYTPSVGVCVNK